MAENTLSAFELAKKLGVVRTRKISNFLHEAAAKLKNKKSHSSPFSFFIVIDFESTCWPDKRVHNPSPEVIEFPAVLYDALNRTVPACDDSTFHAYVMPTEEPILSKFCTELTGIDQEKVNAGCPLPTTMLLFKKWVDKVSHKFNLSFNELTLGKNPAAFVTWTDWDLKICLENECRRKNIRKPRYLDAWIDLKLIYKKFYNRKPAGLNGALKESGLDFDGREHSGICDAKNTAKLLGKMLDDGCALGITKTINDLKIDANLKYDESSLSAGSIKAYLEKMSTTKSSNVGDNSTKTLASKAIDKPCTTSGQRPGLKVVTNTIDQRPVQQNQTIANITSNTAAIALPTARSTPPLCPCGRRARRLVVSKVGPNQGRSFFTCAIKKISNTGKSNGCNFFKWEDGESPGGSSLSWSNFSRSGFETTMRRPMSKTFAAPSTSTTPNSFVDRHNKTTSALPVPNLRQVLPNQTIQSYCVESMSAVSVKESSPKAATTKMPKNTNLLTMEPTDKLADRGTPRISTPTRLKAKTSIRVTPKAIVQRSHNSEIYLQPSSTIIEKTADKSNSTKVVGPSSLSTSTKPLDPSSSTNSTKPVDKPSLTDSTKVVDKSSSTKYIRPTLGPARRAVTTMPSPSRLVQIKRARLSFNSPKLVSNPIGISGCVAPQYFGNVPLHNN